MVRAVAVSLVAILPISATIVPAFGEEDPHAACAAPPSYVPADLLERPVTLRAVVAARRYWRDADPDLPELKRLEAPETAKR